MRSVSVAIMSIGMLVALCGCLEGLGWYTAGEVQELEGQPTAPVEESEQEPAAPAKDRKKTR